MHQKDTYHYHCSTAASAGGERTPLQEFAAKNFSRWQQPGPTVCLLEGTPAVSQAQRCHGSEPPAGGGQEEDGC